ncbi:MAG: hypothetical protein RLZZ114_999 [Bacteroidota bacterium]
MWIHYNTSYLTRRKNLTQCSCNWGEYGFKFHIVLFLRVVFFRLAYNVPRLRDGRG